MKRVTKLIEIDITPDSAGSTIRINGTPVNQCSQLLVTAGVGEASEVTLTLIGYTVRVRGQAGVVTPINERIRRWPPPRETK